MPSLEGFAQEALQRKGWGGAAGQSLGMPAYAQTWKHTTRTPTRAREWYKKRLQTSTQINLVLPES